MRRFLTILTSLILVFSGLLYIAITYIQKLAIDQIWEIFYLFIPAFAVLLLGKKVWKSVIQDATIDKQGLNFFLLYALCTAVLFPALMLLFSYVFGNIVEVNGVERVAIMDTTYFGIFILFVKTLLLNIVGGLTLGLLFAFGGEVAWRGFLEKELPPTRRFIKYVVIGLIWGLWYIPVIILHHNEQNLLLTIVTTLLFYIVASFYLSNILARTHSILATAGVMGIINCTSLIFVANQGNALIVGNTGLFAILSLLLINFICFFRPSSRI